MDNNVVSMGSRGVRPGAGAPSEDATFDMFRSWVDNMGTRMNEMLQLVNVLFLNDRVLRRVILEKSVATQEEVDAVFDDEVRMSNTAMEILQEKIAADAKLTKAKSLGIPLDLMNPIGLVCFDRDMSYNEKMELAKKYELEDVEAFLVKNKEQLISMSPLAI